MKFGGSLVGAMGGAARIAKIVSSHAARNSVVVVVSALGDVTDLLVHAAENAAKWDPAEIAKASDRLRGIHSRAIAETALDSTSKEALVR